VEGYKAAWEIDVVLLVTLSKE